MKLRAAQHPTEALTASLDGALDPQERAALEAHLAGCQACRAERDRLAAAAALLARLPPAPPPSPTFEQRFLARLARERDEARARRGLLQGLAWRWIAPGLATAAVAGAVAVVAVRHRGQELRMAAHLELLEDYEAVASADVVRDREDAEVVAHLQELEGRP